MSDKAELKEEIAELREACGQWQEALSFLAARRNSKERGDRPRCTGVSSDALAWYAVGQAHRPTERQFPVDPSDLQACEITYAMAPPFLRKRMKDVLAEYRAHVAKRYPEVAS